MQPRGSSRQQPGLQRLDLQHAALGMYSRGALHYNRFSSASTCKHPACSNRGCIAATDSSSGVGWCFVPWTHTRQTSPLPARQTHALSMLLQQGEQHGRWRPADEHALQGRRSCCSPCGMRCIASWSPGCQIRQLHGSSLGQILCLSMCTAAGASMLQHKRHALLGAVLAMAQAQAGPGYLPRGLPARSPV